MADTTDRLEMEVVLDPEGFRSQLTQLKQEIGLSLQGASYSAGMTVGAAGAGFNSMARDVGALVNAVMFQPTASQDLGSNPASMLSGLVPSLTAPRSYDVEEWGKLHRDSLLKSVADVGIRATMAAPSVFGNLAGFAAGEGLAGSLGFMGGGLLGGMVGGAIGGAVIGGVAQAVMDPVQLAYGSRKALGSMGGRFGISASNSVLDGIESARQAVDFTGAETLGVLRSGLEQGVFGQVGSADEFNQKFRQLMRGAKEISRTMHTELAESVQMIGSLQNQGFGTIEGAVGAVRMARVTKAMTGINMDEALALAQAGAGMTVGNLGMSAQYGAASTLSNYELITQGMRDKTVDMESVNQLGGRARAAQALTMSGLGFLESPMGRATLLGAYDASTGQLDPSKFSSDPGHAFNQAMTNVFSGANPMKTLLEFAGNRQRVASSASPEEVALAQASTWASLARQIDPKGPITQDMLVGAATVMGVNPDVARTTVGVVANTDALAERQRTLMDQASRAHVERSGRVGGLFGQGGVFGGGGIVGGISNAARNFYNYQGVSGISGRELFAGLGGAVSGLVDVGRGLAQGVGNLIYGTELPEMIIDNDMVRGSFAPSAGGTLSADLRRSMRPVTRHMMQEQAAAAREAVDDILSDAGGSSLASDQAREALMRYMPQLLDDPSSADKLRASFEGEISNMGMETQREAALKAFNRAAAGARMLESGNVPAGSSTMQTYRDRMATVQRFIRSTMSDETAGAGLRLLAKGSQDVRDYAARLPGASAGGVLRHFAGELIEGKTDAAQIPALSGMMDDIRQFKDLGMGSGGGLAFEQLSKVKWDSIGYSEAEIRAADLDKNQVLSKQELQTLTARKISAYGVSKGLGGVGGGTAEDAISGTSMAEMLARNARAIRSLEAYLKKLEAKG